MTYLNSLMLRKTAAIIFLISLLVGLVNFFYLVPPVVNWDEGTHAIWGFREWLALKDSNWLAFWQFTRQQFAYPPLGSWMIALVNFPFEFSIALTRFVSTVGFVISGVLIFLVGSQLSCNNFYSSSVSEKSKAVLGKASNNNNAGLIAFFLFLTSPIILFYSTVVFKEIWGTTLTLFFFFLYFHALKKKTYSSYFWAGCSLIILFWEKYNYAGLVFLTIVLESVIEWVLYLLNFSLERKILREKIKLGKKIIFRQILLFFPLIIFALWWIFTPDNKMEWFVQIMRSDWNPVTVGLGSTLEYLLFYPNSLRASYVFSEQLFWILVVGYILSLKDLASKKIRVLFLLFTVNFVLGTTHAINLQDRYILTTVPALFLIAGFEMEKLISNFQSASWRTFVNQLSIINFHFFKKQNSFVRNFSLVLLLLLVILVLFDFLHLPVFLKSNATHLLSSAMYNEADYHDTIFNFNKSEWPRLNRSSGLWSSAVGQKTNDKRLTTDDYQTTEQVIDYILENIDVDKPTEIVGYTSEISPDWIELRTALRRRKCIPLRPAKRGYEGQAIKCKTDITINNYLVTLEVKPDSRINTYDYKRANSWVIPKIKEITESNKNNLIKEKDFAELGLAVRIYGFK